MTTQRIFKVLQISEWLEFQVTQRFTGSPVDLNDGFIHLSNEFQIQGTLDKHYTEKNDVVLAEVNSDKIKANLKYEISRGGEAFPHLYGTLPLPAITQHWVLSPDSEGRYALDSII